MPSFDYIFAFVRSLTNVIGFALELGLTQIKPAVLWIVREDIPFDLRLFHNVNR